MIYDKLEFMPDDTDTKMFFHEESYLHNIVAACIDNWGTFEDVLISSEDFDTPTGIQTFITITKV